MPHALSSEDRIFVDRFERCELPPPFTHRDHVRLAYSCLTGSDVDAACDTVKASLLRYLDHHGVDPEKYHETLTRAWLLAVRHFMAITPPARSAEEFLRKQPRLLESRIMLKHYSRERLFSTDARRGFLEPDRLPIPRYPS